MKRPSQSHTIIRMRREALDRTRCLEQIRRIVGQQLETTVYSASISGGVLRVGIHDAAAFFPVSHALQWLVGSNLHTWGAVKKLDIAVCPLKMQPELSSQPGKKPRQIPALAKQAFSGLKVSVKSHPNLCHAIDKLLCD